MARGIEGNEISTQKKTTGSSSTPKPRPKQLGIAGFFLRKSDPTPSSVTPAKRTSDGDNAVDSKKAASSSPLPTPALSNTAPASSSPVTAPRASQHSSVEDGRDKENGMEKH